MTGIITNEASFYMRTTLQPPTPAPLLDLFETPSRWLSTDWIDAQHVPSTGIGSDRLRCIWRDGISTVVFELRETAPGTFRLDASLDVSAPRADVGSISNACSIAKQRLLSELAKVSA